MLNQELIDFIKKSKTAGQTDERIKSTLKQSGWHEGDSEEGFKSQSPAAQSVQPKQPTSSVKPAQNYSDILYGDKQNIPPDQKPDVQHKQWHKDWKSYLTIFFLIIIFPLGLLLMWVATNWGRRVKWWITLVPVILIFLSLAISFALVGLNRWKTSQNDNSEQGNIDKLQEATGDLQAANTRWDEAIKKQACITVNIYFKNYYADFGKYPDSLESFVPEYLPELPVDAAKGRNAIPDYKSNGSNDFLYTVTLSSGSPMVLSAKNIFSNEPDSIIAECSVWAKTN